MENETEIDQTREKYFRYLDDVVKQYQGKTIIYRPVVSSMDSELVVIKREGYKIELKDIKNKKHYVSLDYFLQHAEVIEDPAKDAKQRRANGRLHLREENDDGLAEPIRIR